jgi:hypothetical protein
VAAVAAANAGGFVVSYRTAVDADPIQMSPREAASVDFESAAPIRRIGTGRGQRNFGSWWLATTKRHVTFESWCERDHLIAFDFDSRVIRVASQPFRLEFTTSEGLRCPHIPDYFLRDADGGGIVVDVRPEALIDAQDRLRFAGTAGLCRQTGWVYRRVGELPAVLGANLRWLAGYRHERVRDQATVARTREVVDQRSRSPGIGRTAQRECRQTCGTP